MSEKNNSPLDIDLDATISGPIGNLDPARVAALKAASEGDADPEITIAPPPKAVDPDATYNGPLAAFDPDATISNPGGGRRRSNPFAPKALPEALQANLAALGGLNPLIAFANPILSAVPQIGAARNHPDPIRLKETLQDLIEAFEAGASKAGVDDETLEGAVYALCCLADDSAASTPWGKDWTSNGLLHEMRGEANGGEAFFALLKASTQKPEEKANLLEFMYICLALGFRGKYGATGAAEVDRIRADLHALITRRRPRPAGGLSDRWQSTAPAAQAGQAIQASGAPQASIPWAAIGGAAAALLVIVVGYNLMTRSSPSTSPPVAVAPPPPRTTVAAPAMPMTVSAPNPAPAPVVVQPAPAPEPKVPPMREAIEKRLAPEIERGLIAIGNLGGRTSISIRDDRQFGSGTIEPTPSTRAVIAKITEALDGTTGAILVRGYADTVPVKPGPFPSNLELSAARAKAVAGVLGAKLGAKRVTSEGVGEADPIAPNDTEANRAKNRRVAILLGSQP